MNRSFPRWLGRIACALGLLLASQPALAAQPCMGGPSADTFAAPAGWSAGCPDAKAAADLCAAKAQRVQAAVINYAPSDSPLFAVPQLEGVRVAAPRFQALSARGLPPGHSPPLHIRLHRFLS